MTDYNDAPTYIPSKVDSDEMDWAAYAEHYDEMCDLNPSYQHNIKVLTEYIRSWNLPSNAEICDLGAGTGNFIRAISRILPNSTFSHVDFDASMNKLARQKYKDSNVKSVSIIEEYAQLVVFESNRFDLIICVNALYAISPQKQVLNNVRSWLKKDGKFFVIDFGRKQNTLDWTWYLFRESIKYHRIGRYARALIEAREVIKQNRRTSKGQASGRYWTHSTSEFANTLVESGFVVEEVFPCYRGYADLAVCRKSTS